MFSFTWSLDLISMYDHNTHSSSNLIDNIDTEEDFKIMLTKSNSSSQARNAIIEFCCDNLVELANLPHDDLDTSIMNLHKSLWNAIVAVRRVRLNATKCIILHSIRIHFKDRIDCNIPLVADDIAVFSLADINKIRTDYLRSKHTNNTGSNLGDVTVPKITSSKWAKF